MRYMLGQQLYVILRRGPDLDPNQEWVIDYPASLNWLLEHLVLLGTRRDENAVQYKSVGAIRRDTYGVFCLTEWTSSPIHTTVLERDLQRKVRWSVLGQGIEGYDTHVVPSTSPQAPSNYIYHEYYEPDPATWAGLFEDDGKPRPVWRRLIIPFLLVRRWLTSAAAFRTGTASAMEIPRSLRGSRVQRLMAYDDDEALVWIPEKGTIAITIGDVYPFGRLTAISLAETAHCLITASRFAEEAGINFTLADPAKAFRNYYASPDQTPIELADGSSISGSELAFKLVNFFTSYLEAIRKVPGAQEVVSTLARSFYWLP